MNSIHDMGGMQNFGPILLEQNEPVFHHPWEARVYALNRAAGPAGKWNLDATRYGIELIPPLDYLRMSYYERWHFRLVELLIARGVVTRAEVESGHPAPGSSRATPVMTAASISVLAPANPERPKIGTAPRFQVGQLVRARNVHPRHHTRLPRYARGKQGVVARHHGIFVFPDTNANFAGENPQHLYSVSFSARELWGPQASPRDAVHLDMWDEYLDLA